jgi:hypothetical protein
LRSYIASQVIWGITKINHPVNTFGKSSTSGLFFLPVEYAERNHVSWLKLKPHLHDGWPAAAGRSPARRNCGVIDAQIYIVDVDAAWANRRFGTTRRQPAGAARLLSGCQSFLPKGPRRRQCRAAVPAAKSQPIVDVLPQGFREPRDVAHPSRRSCPREWRWRIDCPRLSDHERLDRVARI